MVPTSGFWRQPEPPRLMDRVVALDLRDDLPSEATLEPEARPGWAVFPRSENF